MGTTTLRFAGDLFLSGDYGGLPATQRQGLFDRLAPLLRGSGAVFANFEGVVLTDEPAGLPPGKIRMPVHPDYLVALRRAGVDVLSLSNNHAFDYGPEALAATRTALADAGFTAFGAGADAEEGARLVVRHVDGLSVGFLGFTCASTHPGADAGVALVQDPRLLDLVAAARRQCDLLVVSLHWGDEHVAWPAPRQIALSRQIVDAGADIVAGHHAHVVQGGERWGHGAIAYGLGGLTISGLRQRVVWQGVEQEYRFEPKPRHRRSVVMAVQVTDGRVSGLSFEPVQVGDDGRPAPAHGGRIARALQRVVWHLPGYAMFYRAVLFAQFWFLPRWRALFGAGGIRRLTRLALRR